MNQTQQTNRRILLNSRPHGAPVPENFRLENAEIPKTNAGAILLRTVYLSLDPYMRGRMSDTPSYAPPVAIGDVMVGGAVCRVIDSQHSDYAEGDWVLANSGWQDYCSRAWQRSANHSREQKLNISITPKRPMRGLGWTKHNGFAADNSKEHVTVHTPCKRKTVAPPMACFR